jgi:hypothetical protein
MKPTKPAALPSRFWQGLGQPAVQRRAMWIVPLLFGLISVLLRQDDNWDLRNYHLYNPFAWLNGKIDFDLAPAQMQSYFNPTLDLLYYGLIRALPGPVTGFIMGALHGLNFILLVLIGRALLPQEPGHGRPVLLLALAGMFGAGFVAQIGSTMGDNLTALFILGALLVLLRRPAPASAATGPAALAVLGAGLLAGLGTGLKLTNAVYALALCLSLVALPAPFSARLRCMFTFGVGVLLGIGASAGHWYWKMWTTFGNPLFPQFNNIFHGPLASPMAVGDTNWLPHGWAERLLWPFIFARDPGQVSEIRLSLLVWPILYVAFILLLLHALARRGRAHAADAAARSRHAMLWLFFGLSYLIWMNLFSIYRYLVPLELLAPLVLWLIAQRLRPGKVAARVVACLLLVVVAAVLARSPSWGRAKWAGDSFHADVPAIAQPEESMVLTVHGDPPMGWLATMFPVRLAFVSLSSGFPESDLYRARVAAMVAERSGPLYVMTKAGTAADGETLQRAQQVLAGYGLALVPDSCRRYRAFVGKNPFDYQLCHVNGRPGTSR